MHIVFKGKKMKKQIKLPLVAAVMTTKKSFRKKKKESISYLINDWYLKQIFTLF